MNLQPTTARAHKGRARRHCAARRTRSRRDYFICVSIQVFQLMVMTMALLPLVLLFVPRLLLLYTVVDALGAGDSGILPLVLLVVISVLLVLPGGARAPWRMLLVAAGAETPWGPTHRREALWRYSLWPKASPPMWRRGRGQPLRRCYCSELSQREPPRPQWRQSRERSSPSPRQKCPRASPPPRPASPKPPRWPCRPCRPRPHRPGRPRRPGAGAPETSVQDSSWTVRAKAGPRRLGSRAGESPGSTTAEPLPYFKRPTVGISLWPLEKKALEKGEREGPKGHYTRRQNVGKNRHSNTSLGSHVRPERTSRKLFIC